MTNTDDLIARLRERTVTGHHPTALEVEAADRLELYEYAMRKADDILQDRGFPIESGARRVLRLALVGMRESHGEF